MMTSETPSARKEREHRLLCALQTAVSAKQDLWDALFELAEIGLQDEAPGLEHFDYCVMHLAVCDDPDDLKNEDVRMLLSDVKRLAEEASNR